MNRTITADDIRQYQNVPTEVAAEFIGKDVQFVRIGLRMGRLPFGSAVQNKNWSYHISPGLLIAYQEGTLAIHPILEQEIVVRPGYKALDRRPDCIDIVAETFGVPRGKLV